MSTPIELIGRALDAAENLADLIMRLPEFESRQVYVTTHWSPCLMGLTYMGEQVKGLCVEARSALDSVENADAPLAWRHMTVELAHVAKLLTDKLYVRDAEVTLNVPPDLWLTAAHIVELLAVIKAARTAAENGGGR